jgi:hypothetical protein
MRGKGMRVERFELKDARGEPVARLGVGKSGRASLALLDEAGRQRLGVSFAPGPELRQAMVLWDEEGEERIVVSLLPDERAVLQARSPAAEESGFSLQLVHDEERRLVALVKEGGETCAAMSLAPEAEAELALAGREGLRASACLGSKGCPEVRLLDGEGRTRAHLLVGELGDSFLTEFGVEARPRNVFPALLGAGGREGSDRPQAGGGRTRSVVLLLSGGKKGVAVFDEQGELIKAAAM